MIKQTHTYANLAVSEAAYREIKGKLQAAGYVENPEDAVLPMQGIALVSEDNEDEYVPPKDMMPLVFAAIEGEREYQERKHGHTDHRGIHSVTEWLVYIEQYLQQAKQIVTHHSDPDASKRALCVIRKVAAMGVACMEQNGIVTRMEEQALLAKDK